MNKKHLAILLCVASIFVWGCESKYVEDSEKETKEDAIEKKASEEKELANYLSELIPDPKEYFFNTEFEIITNENSYTVYLDYVSEEEWNAYIEKCKEDGVWTKESYQSAYSWYALSEDENYKLLLDRYGDKNEYMTILVKEESKNEKYMDC